MTYRLAVTIVALALTVTFVHAEPTERPEVQRLCKKWAGKIMTTLTTGPVYLRCSHIRKHFDRIAKEGPTLKTVRLMIESIKHQNLLKLTTSDLPKDQKCTIVKGTAPVMTCTTLDFEPQTSTQFFGTKEGLFTNAVVSMDLDWFRREMTRQMKAEIGAPPTAAFLEYYLELLVTVNSSLGGPNEQYSIDGNQLVLRIKVN